MAQLCHLFYFFLVDFDSQPWSGKFFNISFFIFKVSWVFKVVQKVGAFIVMNAQALFLDKGIRGTEIQLEAGCQCNGPQRTVGATDTS